MLFDLDSAQGEWFQFFNSRIDPSTGETIFDEPIGDARVQIRGMIPFFEERLAKRKKEVERVLNPKTRAMERISFYPDLSFEEAQKERDDGIDYAITGLENFKDSKTGEIILCTRENKLKLMRVPVFDRFIARCFQLLASSGVKDKEEEKNLIEWIEWADTYAPTCPGCQKMYAKRNPPETPPCVEGTAATNWQPCRVELREENDNAGQIYYLVRGQVRTLGEQVVDLDYVALKVVMDLYQIRDQRDVFDKVRHLFYHFLNEKRGE